MAIPKNSRKKTLPRSSPAKHSYKFIVSACLAGQKCTYNGKSKLLPGIREMVSEGLALAVCPEVAGGGKIPRERCEIAGGDGHDVLTGRAKVITISGRDVSSVILAGAKRTLGLARRHRIGKAILKSKSPSCGRSLIYDGTFTGSLIKGDGVTAAMLSQKGLKIYTEKDYYEK